MPYKLSQTTLNLLVECPRCFWLHFRKGIKRPESPIASIVIKIDSLLKSHFDSFRHKGGLPPLIRGQVSGKLAMGMPKTLKYEDKETGLLLVGRPDEYLEIKPGVIVAFDHKTKSKASKEIHPAYRIQLDTYSYLLRMSGYKTEDKAYISYYYQEECDPDGGLDMRAAIVEVKTNPGNAKRLLQEAEKVLKGPMPAPGERCEYCAWRRRVQG